MKVEYKKSLSNECELHIPSSEYRYATSKTGWDDHSNLMFAVNAYLCVYKCENRITRRDLEEANRCIKKSGTIVLVPKLDEMNGTFCEVHVITDGSVIPVITYINGDKHVNYSAKTQQERKARKAKQHKEEASND